VALRDERNAAKVNVVDVEEKLAKVGNDVSASSAAVEKRYEAYQAEVKKGLALLRKSYEAGVNGIGGWCTRLPRQKISCAGSRLKWLHCPRFSSTRVITLFLLCLKAS
jgi:hypothetical protein